MEKTIDHRLAWLAGIIDGEGWIGFSIRTKKRGSKTYKYAAWYVAVSNTNPAMLCEVASIADSLAAHYSYQLHNKQRGNRKEQQRITFAGKADVLLILNAILPYLINKRPQAELTLRALQHKYGGDEKNLLYRSSGGLDIDFNFKAMVEEIHFMNQRGVAGQGEK